MKKILLPVILFAVLFIGGNAQAEELVCDEGYVPEDVIEMVCRDVLVGEEVTYIEHPATCKIWLPRPFNRCVVWNDDAWTEEVVTPMYEEQCGEEVTGSVCVLEPVIDDPIIDDPIVDDPIIDDEEPILDEEDDTVIPVIPVELRKVFAADNRCHALKPIAPTWSRYENDMLTWSAINGSLVEIRFGYTPEDLKYTLVTLNDGHEEVGVGTKAGWWSGYWKMRTVNLCRVGAWSPVYSGTGSW
jgi:hypothetical protein